MPRITLITLMTDLGINTYLSVTLSPHMYGLILVTLNHSNTPLLLTYKPGNIKLRKLRLGRLFKVIRFI